MLTLHLQGGPARIAIVGVQRQAGQAGPQSRNHQWSSDPAGSPGRDRQVREIERETPSIVEGIRMPMVGEDDQIDPVDLSTLGAGSR